MTTPKTISSACSDAELSAAVAEARGYHVSEQVRVLQEDREFPFRLNDPNGNMVGVFCSNAKTAWEQMSTPYAESLDAIVPVVEKDYGKHWSIMALPIRNCYGATVDHSYFMAKESASSLCLAYLKAKGYTVTDATAPANSSKMPRS